MAFRKILCPIDFSMAARRAMYLAVEIAKTGDAELVLVHAVHVPTVAFSEDPSFPASVLQKMSDDAERALAAAAAEAIELGTSRVSTKLLTGPPADQILAELADPTVDLAVVSTHGRTGLSRFLIGSVAEKVVRHAPCSVLAMRPNGDPRPFTHILCSIDFSEAARHATRLAADLVRPGGAGITLLHVIAAPLAYAGEPQTAEFLRTLERLARCELEEWAAELRTQIPAAIPIVIRTQLGNPGVLVPDALEADPSYDLVAMGSHGRTGVRRVLLGSLAERVVRHAKCPVLVARQRV